MSIARSTVPRSLRARWVFPVAGPPLRDATVTIYDGRIVAVGTPPHDGPIEDLGPVAIVLGPCHARLRIGIQRPAPPIGRPGMGLVEWLGKVVRHRANAPVLGRWCVEQGLRNSSRHGVTTIGEIAQLGGTDDAYLASPCDGTLFLELIAPRDPRRVEAAAVGKRRTRKHRSIVTSREHSGSRA